MMRFCRGKHRNGSAQSGQGRSQMGYRPLPGKNCAKKTQFYRFVVQILPIPFVFFFLIILLNSSAYSSGPPAASEQSGKPPVTISNEKQDSKTNAENQSISRLLKKVQAHPDNIVTRRELGVQYIKVKKYYKAIAEFSEIINQDSSNLEAYYFLSNLYKKTGQGDMALWSFKEVTRLDPGDVEAYYELAALYRKKGFSNEVIKEYKKIARIKPDDADAHYNLGVLYAKNSMKFLNDELEDTQSGWFMDYNSQAIEEFQKAIDLKPNHANAHFNLGISYYYISFTEKANEEYTLLKKINPELAEKLGRLLKKKTSEPAN